MRELAIAVVVIGFIVAVVMLLLRRGPSSAGIQKIPPALKPGDPDDVLESDRLTKVIRYGLGIVMFFAVFLPVYWWAEPGRMTSKEKAFAAESIKRGSEYFALRVDQQTGEENHTGIECARCHGSKAQGGENQFLEPSTGQQRTVKVPSLFDVFARYEKPPPGFKDAKTFVRETVERGRPGTDMPTWGNGFGGPLTDQQIEDIVNFLESIQHVAEIPKTATGADIFGQNCSTCHGIGGTGGRGPAMVNGSESAQFPGIEDHIAFVKAGSKADTPYGKRGKGTAGMPAWGSILTDEQIRLVVEYERSL